MHYIYILTDRTYSKIGITKNLKKRISTYSGHNPSFSLFKHYESDNLTAKMIEGKIKTMFQLDTVRSSKEWFTIDANLIDKEVKKLIQIAKSISLIKKELDLPIKKINKSLLRIKNIDDLNFTDKELRDIANFEAIYEKYIDNEREYKKFPYVLCEKTVKGNTYLYQQKTKTSSFTSIGLLEGDNLNKLNTYKEEKEYLDTRSDTLIESLQENIRYFRVSKANRVDSKVAQILRQLDKENALGRDVLVVGTNAFVAYEIHAQTLLFPENMSTDDFNLTWYRNTFDEKNENHDQKPLKLIQLLQDIDKTYVLNHNKPFQAVNAHGYEVELLAAPSVINTQANLCGFRPIPLMEQEWLLMGTPVRHILLSNDLKPAPIVAPDPRWMALHKIWLSQKPIRDKAKVQKDFKQGTRLLNLVVEKMQYEYPLDNSFISQLPKELKFLLDIHAKTTTKKPKPF